MRNHEIAEHLRAVAYRYRNSGDKSDKFKAIAFSKAATAVESHPSKIKDMPESDLLAIAGVGKSTVAEIREFVAKGQTARAELLNKDAPPLSIKELEELDGVGSKTAERLWREHGITCLADLRRALENFKIVDQKWTDRLKEFDQRSDRLPRHVIMPFVTKTLERLDARPFVWKVKAAGSVRRFKETIGDIDILIACGRDSNAKLVNWLTKRFEIVRGGYEEKNGQPIYRSKVTAITYFNGKTKQVDFNICEPEEWGCYLSYLTGSKEFNIALRSHALKMGYSLNEFCVTEIQSGEQTFFEKESALFEFLKIPFVPPECRIDGSEVGKSFDNLLINADIQGDFHTHSIFSDGEQTPEMLVASAKTTGLRWLGIADHDDTMPITKGLKIERVQEYLEAIRKARESTQFPLMAGIELDVSAKGSLRYDINTLNKFNFIILATHKEPQFDITARLCAALRFTRFLPIVILAHPLNRHLPKTTVPEINWDSILAVRPDVIIEINAQPDRLDLPYEVIKTLKGRVKFTIASDKHDTNSLIATELAVKEARKAGLTKDDIFDPITFKDGLAFSKS